MKRFMVFISLLCVTWVQPAWAGDEIGYVEDFTGLPANYLVRHGATAVPVRLCLPLYSGDTIEALDDRGRVTLRLMDHPDPIVWSRADKDRPLSAEVPKASYWSSLMTSTLAALSPFDDQKRERVLTAIRGDGGDFGVPLLQAHQTMAAGQRGITLGSLKSSAVTEISITSKSGQTLVNKSKGVGGLWTSPALNLKPGQYHVVVAAGSNAVSGDLDVVAAEELPQFPPELTQAGIPDALRRTAEAVWLAAQDGGHYHLEALQLIANDRNRPASVLTDALISGKTIDVPK